MKKESYLYQLTTFHEDMHDEAFTFPRQTLSYPAPEFRAAKGQAAPDVGALPGDADVAGGQIELGCVRTDRSFSITRSSGMWSKLCRFRLPKPRRMRRSATSSKTAAIPTSVTGATRAGAGVKKFDECIPSIGDAATTATGGCVISTREFRCRQNHPVISHVSWFEADAWCRWADSSFAEATEWEAAAAYGPTGQLKSDMLKRRYAWGDSIDGCPANLDGRHLGVVDVGAYPTGDSAVGCRQMIGNVWEWTSSDFLPFPGFGIDPYRELFETVVRHAKGTKGWRLGDRSRMVTNTYQKFLHT